MASLSPSAKQQFFTNAGALAANCKLYTYDTGTVTPRATYTDRAGGAANANPIILDARGEATIYLLDQEYRYVLKSADDLTTFWTRDNVSSSQFEVRADLASTAAGKGASLVGFIAAGVGAVARWIMDKLRERISVADYGAVGDGVTDDTAALQAAITAAAGKELWWNAGTYKLTNELVISSALRMRCARGSVQLNQATQNKNHFRIGDGTTPTRTATLETVIDGFTFAPQEGVAAFTSGAAIKIAFGANFHIRNCDVYGRDSTARKLWNAYELDRASDGRIVDCKARECKNSTIFTYGAAGIANRTVDVRIDNFRGFSCDNNLIHFGAHTGGMFLNSPILLNVAASMAGIYINADPATEQGTNYYIANPNIEGGNAAGSVGILVNKGQSVQVQNGWIGGFLPASAGISFAAGASSCEAHGTQVDNCPVRIDGAAIQCSGLRVSGDNATMASGFYVAGTATAAVIEGGRVRQCTGAAIAFAGNPVNCRVSGVTFQTNGSSVSGTSYASSPTVRDCRSDATTSYTAAATLAIPHGVDFIQVTGATNIATLGENSKGRRLSIQSGAGGITFVNTGNLLLKGGVASFALTAFRTVSFVCDGLTWFQDGDSN